MFDYKKVSKELLTEFIQEKEGHNDFEIDGYSLQGNTIKVCEQLHVFRQFCGF